MKYGTYRSLISTDLLRAGVLNLPAHLASDATRVLSGQVRGPRGGKYEYTGTVEATGRAVESDHIIVAFRRPLRRVRRK